MKICFLATKNPLFVSGGACETAHACALRHIVKNRRVSPPLSRLRAHLELPYITNFRGFGSVYCDGSVIGHVDIDAYTLSSQFQEPRLPWLAHEFCVSKLSPFSCARISASPCMHELFCRIYKISLSLSLSLSLSRSLSDLAASSLLSTINQYYDYHHTKNGYTSQVPFFTTTLTQ